MTEVFGRSTIDERGSPGFERGSRTTYVEPPTTLAVLVRLARTHWRLVGAMALATAAIAVPLLLLQPREYSSTGSFVIQGTGPGTNLAGIASQFGISMQTADGQQSPAFFADLLKARTILESVTDTQYCAPCNAHGQPQQLPALLGITGDNPKDAREKTILYLSRHISSGVSPRTGLVMYAVTLPSAALAQQVARRLVSEVAQFNVEMRQNDMEAERKFTERRLEEVAGDLHVAEQALSSFQASNHDFSNSPRLMMREEELRREVGIRQQLYLSLAQAVAQARMEEGRDTPVLSIVDPPLLPFRPNSRGIAVKGAFALIFGALIGIMFVYFRDRSRAREDRLAPEA